MLLKLAFAMQRLKKYLKKNVVMINKDGEGNDFWILWGGHSCYDEGHRAHGGPLHQGKPCSEALLGLKSTECADFQVKF